MFILFFSPHCSSQYFISGNQLIISGCQKVKLKKIKLWALTVIVHVLMICNANNHWRWYRWAMYVWVATGNQSPGKSYVHIHCKHPLEYSAVMHFESITECKAILLLTSSHYSWLFSLPLLGFLLLDLVHVQHFQTPLLQCNHKHSSACQEFHWYEFLKSKNQHYQDLMYT